jgi:hypothetical protein
MHVEEGDPARMDGCTPNPQVMLKGEVVAACIQAAATADAAYWQSWAAWGAGGLTLLAGLLAVGAAVYGTAGALRGVRDQIEAQQALQVADQRYTTKRDVYLSVITAGYTGLLAMARFADPRISVDMALAEYTSQAAKVAQVHLVAPMEVIEVVMSSTLALSKAHLKLIAYRNMYDHTHSHDFINIDHLRTLGHVCLTEMAKMTGTLTDVAIAMRDDLELRIDRETYQNFVEGMMQQTVELSREVISGVGPASAAA